MFVKISQNISNSSELGCKVHSKNVTHVLNVLNDLKITRSSIVPVVLVHFKKRQKTV
jgi:hypothetical protein